jgi:hypothetical protein
MKIRNKYRTALGCFLVIGWGLHGQYSSSTYNVSGKTYHVHANALSGGDGSPERPFQTLEQARDAMRIDMFDTVTPPEGAVIELGPGTYQLEDSFILDENDAFPAYSQLTIQGSTEGSTVIQMGISVPWAAIEPVLNRETLQRLRPEARKHISAIDLAALGIDLIPLPELFKGLDGGQPELFFNGERLPISRYPNEGTMTMGELISSGIWWDGRSEGGAFKFKDDRHLAWSEAVDSGLWLNGFWRIPWQSWSIRVASIDSVNRVVQHALPIAEGMDSDSVFAGIGSKYTRPLGSLKEPYFAFNLLEEIDQPGEWSIDYSSNTLYVWLPEAEGELVLSHKTAPLFELKGTSQIRLRHLTFTGGRENGVVIYGGLDNVVEHCVFKNLGGWGVIVRGGFRNGVRNSHFSHLGKGGIEISGGDSVNLVPCHNFADNNQLHDLNQLQRTWAGAIKLGVSKMHGGSIGTRQAVGISVTNNEIYNLPHIGILAGGNFNQIKGNIIYNIATETDDVGYIYTRHDMTSRGNTLTDNLFYGSPHAHGFHIDDGDSGDLIQRNVVIGSKVGLQIGGGHDNIVSNNFFIDCGQPCILDDRGIFRNYTLENAKKVAEMMITERAPKAWYGHFPELREIYRDKPEWPRGNRFTGNHFIRSKKTDIFVIDGDGLLDVMKKRNIVEGNRIYDAEAYTLSASESVDYFRRYLNTHGKMPETVPGPDFSRFE